MSKHLFLAAKIAAGCVLAIIIATLLGLQYSATAGIITILSIQDTKQETLTLGIKRFVAFLMAILIAAVSFHLFGYNTVGFGAYLVVFLFLCIVCDWKSAMAMDSVLIVHFWTEQNMELPLIWNELLLFAIGVSIGIVMNLHLRKDREKMAQKEDVVDDEIRGILRRMSLRVASGDNQGYSKECFERVNKLVEEAAILARENRLNTFTRQPQFDEAYVDMRRKQCQILYEMYRKITHMTMSTIQAKLVSEYLDQVAREYHKDNDATTLLIQLSVLMEQMKKEPLPVERTEFENRAILYAFLVNTREFLEIKNSFLLENREMI